MKTSSNVLSMLGLVTLTALAPVQAVFAADYPSTTVKKKMYADNDFRGKKAPALNVQKWLTKEPDTKDKVVLVDFWATWCGPCRRLVPEMNEYQKKFAKDLVVIGISDEEAGPVKEFMGRQAFDYAVGLDENRSAKGALGVSGIPHVMIYTPDGIVRWQGFPGSDKDPLTEDVVAQIIAAYKEGRK